MDRLDNTQLPAALVSTTENSPVFDYMTSLSPIMPLNAIHTDHAFDWPSLTSASSDVSKSTIDVSKIMAHTPGPPCYSPSSNHFGIQSDHMSQLGGTSVPYVQEGFEKDSFEWEKNLDGHIEHIKEESGHGLQSLVSDTGSPWIFTSPKRSESMRLIQDPQDPMARDLMLPLLSNELHYMHELPIADGEETYNEPASHLHYGTWWPGLDFETVGDCRNDIEGIGYLKDLVNNLKDCTEKLLSSYGGQLTLPCTTGQVHISSTSHEPPFILADCERKMVHHDRWIKIEEEAPQASHNVLDEEFYWGSPKKKRPRSDLAREKETCQRCKCTRTMCLNLYCKCFAAGLYCIGPCLCQGCRNEPNHNGIVFATRKLIKSRNPLAFTPKVIKSSDHTAEYRGVPRETRHKTRCNCKKSSCSKKYCQCFQGGVGCSSSCKCVGCKNGFGAKDGIDEETKSFQKNFSGNSFTCTDIRSNPEQDLGSAFPITTSSLLHRPFTLQDQSFCSSFVGVGTPSALCGESKLENLNILISQPEFEKDEELVLESKVPDYRDCSSTTSFSSAFPNIKKVSLPCSDPAIMLCEKFILGPNNPDHC